MMGQLLLEKWLLKRFLISLAGLLAFAVMISVLLSALMLTGLYAAFHLMQQHGMTADMALLAASGLGVLLIMILAAFAVRYFHHLQKALSLHSTLAAQIGQAAADFICGLLAAAPKQD